MVKDYWPKLYSDKYAVLRLEKSVSLADIRPGMSVLDVGAHKGELASFMPDEVLYLGIDHLNGYDIDGQIDVMGKWDRILCLETLEHLKYPKKTLKEISDHLRDDGIAVISLPNEATLFHRIRSLLGTVDGECFGEDGKHLHLPSLHQSMEFLSVEFHISQVIPYFSLNLNNSRQSWLEPIAKLIPNRLFELLGGLLPSLFARGFIFVCKKKETLA